MTSPFGILGRALGAGPLGGLKRYLRWFNLTMLQQAIWPLLIAVASAPQVDLEATPPGWFLLRLAGPAVAVVVALLYLRSGRNDDVVIPSEVEGSLVRAPYARSSETSLAETPRDSSTPLRSGRNDIVIPSEVEGSLVEGAHTRPSSTSLAKTTRASSIPLRSGRNGVGRFARLALLTAAPSDIRAPGVAIQLRYALLALPVVVGVIRLIAGPFDEAAKIVLFGLVNVAAYQLIHFGVAPLSFDDRRQGLFAGAILFGLSWGIYNALMFGLTDEGNWVLGLAAGCVLGWVFGFGTLTLRRWPGGALTGAAVQFLVVYLVAGFV